MIARPEARTGAVFYVGGPREGVLNVTARSRIYARPAGSSLRWGHRMVQSCREKRVGPSGRAASLFLFRSVGLIGGWSGNISWLRGAAVFCSWGVFVREGFFFFCEMVS